MTEGEKKLSGVGILIAQVNNGGFDQYFFNTNGEYAEDTLEFLNECGLDFIHKKQFWKILEVEKRFKYCQA